MSNHVHMIIGTRKVEMQAILRDIKKHTSKTIVKVIRDNQQESRQAWMIWMFERAGQRNPNNEYHQFWQQHNNPIELFSMKYRNKNWIISIITGKGWLG